MVDGHPLMARSMTPWGDPSPRSVRTPVHTADLVLYMTGDCRYDGVSERTGTWQLTTARAGRTSHVTARTAVFRCGHEIPSTPAPAPRLASAQADARQRPTALAATRIRIASRDRRDSWRASCAAPGLCSPAPGARGSPARRRAPAGGAAGWRRDRREGLQKLRLLGTGGHRQDGVQDGIIAAPASASPARRPAWPAG